MAKKRILKELKITAIAAVDRPAQEGALSTILKRSEVHPSGVVAEAMAKRWLDPSEGARGFEEFLENTLKDKRYYEIMEEVGPKIDSLSNSLRSITADAGLDMASKRNSMRDSIENFMVSVQSNWPEVTSVMEDMVGKFDEHVSKHGQGVKPMPQTEQEKQIAELQKSVTDLTAAVEVAKAAQAEAETIAKLSDAEKEFISGMDDKARKEFMALSTEDRAKKMKKSAEADEVVSVAGHEVRKSAVGDAQFAIFKAQAQEIEELRKSRTEDAAKIAKAHYEAEADAMLKNVPGTVEVRGGILKAVDEIADEEVRKSLRELLVAHDKIVKKAFSTVGSDLRKEDETDKGAIKKFETIVTDIMKRDSVSRTSAMEKAANENPDEYAAYRDA